MNTKGLNVVLAGGGTGGHVIPAIAIAEEVVARGGTARFVGTSDRIEARLVPQAGFGIDFVKVHPLAGGGMMRVAKGLASVPPAVFGAMRLISNLDPDVVLGVGGYVAGPVVLAARLGRIKTALLEQNASVGLANKLLARVVDRAFVSYEVTLEEFTDGRAVLTGNPVGSSIRRAALLPKTPARGSRVRILVMGGSQGALTIDERVPRAIEQAGIADQVEVLHQSGPNRSEQVAKVYQQAGIEARVIPFIDDTAAAYAHAQLVVSRCGATTVAEVTAMGLPAVFIPYPHHADKQQERNAKPMQMANAAVVLDENEAGVDELAGAIGEFVKDPSRLLEASQASAKLGRPDAANQIVDGLERLTGRVW